MEDPLEAADSHPEEGHEWEASRLRAALLASFAIGAAVGLGLALVWVPERRHGRLPPAVGRRYERARRLGAETLDEIRRAAGRATGQIREELAVDLEAARGELADIARDQVERFRKKLERQYRRVR
jgi:hypothetical protein